MTPRMVHALRKRQLAEWQRQEFMSGQICATTANFSQRGPKKALSAEVFMLHPPTKRKPERVTGEMLLQMFDPKKWKGNK